MNLKLTFHPKDILAVPKTMSVASVLAQVRQSGYSRIPVYDGEIDNIVGIILAKSVLDFFVRGVLVEEDKQKDEEEESVESISSNASPSEMTVVLPVVSPERVTVND